MCEKCVVLHIFDTCFVQIYTFSTHRANISAIFVVSELHVFFGSPAKACGLGIDSRKSKQEEFSVDDASELSSELFDFSIERFRRCIGRTVNKIV